MSLRRIAGVLVLSIMIGAPMIEAFDSWDDTLRDGNDSEANLAVAALCIGLALTCVGSITGAIRLSSTRCHTRSISVEHRCVCVLAHVAAPIPTGSPPFAIRI